MRGDLHVHTNISDGSYSIEEILQMAKENGLTHIAITNHDTVKGLKEAIDLGKEYGIKVIPGIEISAFDFENDRKVHILGYNFSLEGKNIKQLCDPLLDRRGKNSMNQVEKLLLKGYELDFEYLSKISSESGLIYKQHIMDALIKNHYTDSIYSDLYRRIFKNNGICAFDIEYVDYLDAVNAIKADGGVAVLAHPGQLNSYDIIDNLVNSGLWGIELNHHSHTKDDLLKIKEISNNYNLHLTGGTDFHGKYSEKYIELGSICAPDEVLNLL